MVEVSQNSSVERYELCCNALESTQSWTSLALWNLSKFDMAVDMNMPPDSLHGLSISLKQSVLALWVPTRDAIAMGRAVGSRICID